MDWGVVFVAWQQLSWWCHTRRRQVTQANSQLTTWILGSAFLCLKFLWVNFYRCYCGWKQISSDLWQPTFETLGHPQNFQNHFVWNDTQSEPSQAHVNMIYSDKRKKENTNHINLCCLHSYLSFLFNVVCFGKSPCEASSFILPAERRIYPKITLWKCGCFHLLC